MELAHLPALDKYGERISNLSLESLRVTITTIKPVAYYEPLALDGIIALAVVLDNYPNPFPRSELPFWLPLPLGLEKSIDGLPLWQSTNLYPIDAHSDITHYHKRTDDNPYSFPAIMPTLQDKKPRRQPSTVAGQYMNYRIPERRVIADCWQATCVGNRDEIERLLIKYVTHIGKGAAKGNGRVLDWEIEPLDTEFSFYANGARLRPIPTDDLIGVVQGWTPPYWRRDTWRICEAAID